MKILFFRAALAASCLLAVSEMSAAPVTFYFTGRIENYYNPSSLGPAGLGVGTPYVGKVTYDGANVFYSDTRAGYGYYYLTNAAGFTMTLQVGGHTFTSVPANNGYQNGLVGLEDKADNDYWMADTESAEILLDGAPFQPYPLITSMGLWLQDSTGTANSSISLPTAPPDIARFDNREFNLVTRKDDGASVNYFAFWGTVDSITTTEPVALSITPAAANSVKLSWSATAKGYTLQSAAALAGGAWTTVTNTVSVISGQKVVTLPASGDARFFRLSQ